MTRLFELDFQLVHDALFMIVAIFFLFVMMSYLLFNPISGAIKKRQDAIRETLKYVKIRKREADYLRAQYMQKINEIEEEAEEMLSEARKKALENENRIIAQAKEEAIRIMDRAAIEVELEKKRAADDIKREMVVLASLMAAKVVTVSMDTAIQDSLIEETLKEVGESTWLS